MAWWDHEELKPREYRSDRYIIAFPSEYSTEEVVAAIKRRRTKTEKAGYTVRITISDEMVAAAIEELYRQLNQDVPDKSSAQYKLLEEPIRSVLKAVANVYLKEAQNANSS